MSHQCYGCQQVFQYKDLAYECMCDPGDKSLSHGVCIQCTDDKKPLQIKDPQHHHLSKIHKFSDESKQIWFDIEEKCPGWGGFSFNKDNRLCVTHPNFPNGIKSWEDMDEKSRTDLMYSEKRNKTTTFPIVYDDFMTFNQCTCCH